MTPFLPLLSVARFAAQIGIAAIWQGLLLVATVALGLRLLPRLSASFRFAVWSATFVLAAALPWLQHPATAQSAVRPSSLPTLHLGSLWIVAAISLWALLTAFRTVQLAREALRVFRIGARALPIPQVDDATAAFLLQAPRAPRLCTSRDVDAPAVIGFFAPRLLIPEDLLPTLAPAELRHIVLHECEHLRRRDDWINLLQKIALALFPLHPALFLIDRRLGLERELACDAGVIASTGLPLDYARSLARLAEHRLHTRSLSLALAAWSRQSELARRVHTLLRPRLLLSPMAARTSAALLAVALAGTSFEIARAPRLVSFDSPAAPAQLTASAAAFHPAMQPVQFQRSQQPRTVLTRAILTRTVVTRSPAPAGGRPLPTESAGLQRRAAPSTNPSRMILTDAIQTPTQASPATTRARNRRAFPGRNDGTGRPVYLLSTSYSFSYAAVPMPGGWLILQL